MPSDEVLPGDDRDAAMGWTKSAVAKCKNRETNYTMTRDNNESRKKANAVFFSVIMVISMAAIGFAAAPAAADDADTGEIEFEDQILTTDGNVTATVNELNGTNATVVVTYQNESDDSVVAGSVSGQNITDDPDAIVEILDDEGFPGEHTAHLFNQTYAENNGLGSLTGGEFVDEDTAAAALDADSATISDINEVGANVNVDDLIFQGQVIYSENVTAGETVQLRQGTPGDSSFVRQKTAQAPGKVQFQSTSLEADDYFLRQGGEAVAQFEVAIQSFDGEFDPAEVDNGGDDTTTTHTIDTNRGDDFDLELSAEFDGDDVDADDLAELVDGDTTVEDDLVIVSGVGDEDELTLDFDDTEAGEYDITVEVADTTVSATETIEVSDIADGDVSFDESFITEEQGDIAEITIQFEGDQDEAFLRIGDEDDVGYESNITVDSEGADEVTIGFNTYAAGDAALDDNLVTVVSEDGDITFEEQTEGLGAILATGTYPIELSDESHDEIADDNSVDVGDLDIEERSVDDFLLWTASEDAFDTVLEEDEDDRADAVLSAAENDTVQQTDTIAGGDVLIHDLQASGLEGLIENDFDDAIDGDLDSILSTLTETDAAAGNGTDLRIRQTSDTTPPNSDRKRVNVTASAGAFDVIEGDDRYFLAVNPDEFVFQDTSNEVEDGDAFNVRLRIKDDRLLNVDEDELDDADDIEDFYETVTATFTYEDAEGEFDEPVEVEAGEEQSVTGTSNVAPGQELTVRVRSASGVSPGFVLSQNDVTIDSDGSFEATLDFTETSVGDEFTATVRQATFDASEDGVVVEGVDDEDDVDETDDADDVDETDDADDVDETDDADDVDETDDVDDADDVDDTEDDTPGFGALVALVALIAAALLATRRRP